MAIGKLPDADEMAVEDDEAIFAEINITPLTDVFLVMVIIFMVSALAVQVEERQKQKKITQQQQEISEIEKKSGIKVNLPSGQAQEIDPTKTSLVLVIPQNGQVLVGGKLMTPAELDNLFRAAYARDKSTQVVLKADKAVQHGIVVNVMEKAKAAGLTRLAIGTSGG
ncbi:MAG TPA: biopolymer transporter ExbD [Kofleriaceae bacterium]|jgi:biopolymer transport protein ExbD